MSLVHVRERNRSRNVEALEWFILTTLPVNDAEEARQVLRRYALRWRIEDYFRVLETGCKAEDLYPRTAECLGRAIAANIVGAWRVQSMIGLGRQVPDLPAERLFSDKELRVIAALALSRKLTPPTSLGKAVEVVAQLSAWYELRRPPDARNVWQGYMRLVTMVGAFELIDKAEQAENASRDPPP